MKQIKFKAKSDELRLARTSQKMQQREMAVLISEITDINVALTTYSMIEQGRRSAKLEVAVAICRILGKDLNQLFRSSGDVKIGSEL